MTTTTGPATALLELRLRTLAADVQRVGDAVTVAEGRNAGVESAAREAERASEEIAVRLSDIGARVRAVLGLVDDQQVRDVVAQLEYRGRPASEVLRDAREVSHLAEAVEDSVRALRDRVNELGRPHVAFGLPLTDKLKWSLGNRCKALNESIERLQARLDEGAAEPVELWLEFTDLLHQEARPLFREYVDFLGGVTVRDTGLDGRTSAMTEVLLSQYQGLATWFPIPAAQAALSSAMDSVVKIGFPEWSIWGVPLAAHEVGVSVSHGHDAHKIAQLLDTWAGRDIPRALLEDLVGDGFGAYYGGPAYGGAALLLRFQPHPNGPAARSDVERARLVLHVLAAATQDPDSSGAATVRSLAELWTATVQTLAGTGTPPDLAWVDDFADGLLDALGDLLGLDRFGADAQARVQELRRPLAEAAVSPEPSWEHDQVARLELRRDYKDLRALLNAAWAERLRGAVSADELAERVRRLWSRATAPRTGARATFTSPETRRPA